MRKSFLSKSYLSGLSKYSMRLHKIRTREVPYIIEYRICPKSELDNVILLNLQEYKIRIENGNYDNVLS